MVAAIAGGVLGLTAGYLLAGAVGRNNGPRLQRAVDRLRRSSAPALWTAEASERLEASVLDALHQDVVLARRPIRVTVLGQGLVELTGKVLHVSEVSLAGAAAQATPGVATVLNHLMVQAPPGTPHGAPRAAG